MGTAAWPVGHKRRECQTQLQHRERVRAPEPVAMSTAASFRLEGPAYSNKREYSSGGYVGLPRCSVQSAARVQARRQPPNSPVQGVRIRVLGAGEQTLEGSVGRHGTAEGSEELRAQKFHTRGLPDFTHLANANLCLLSGSPMPFVCVIVLIVCFALCPSRHCRQSALSVLSVLYVLSVLSVASAVQ